MNEIKALRAFQLIMELGSLAAAARALNASEPSLSRQIAALERALGIRLFSRDQRSLAPTPEGEAFFAQSRWIVGAVDRLPEVAAEIRSGSLETVRIVTMPRMSHAVAMPAIAMYRAAYPASRIAVDVQSRQNLEQWIAGQRFDIGLGSLPTRHPDIETETVFSVSAVALLPPDHPLSGQGSLNLKQLSGEKFIALNSGSLIHHQANEMLDHAGAQVETVITVTQTLLACELVCCGAGFTIADPLIAQPFAGRLCTVPIVPHFQLDFGTFHRRGEPRLPAVEVLMEMISDAAQPYLQR